MTRHDAMNFHDPYDAELTPHERLAVHRARAYCEGDFRHAVNEAFVAGEPFPRSVIDDWAALGLLGLQVDRSQGGLGASYLAKIRVAQEMARHGFAAAFCLNNMQGIATRVGRQGSAKQQAELLQGLMQGKLVGAPSMSEPQAGSDMGQLACEASPVPEGWRLRGTKAWVTNGAIVDVLTALCRVPDSAGSEIAGFLVKVEGGSARRREVLMPGARSFRLAEIVFEDHFVPDWSLFQPPGEAFRSSLHAINAARVHVAAMCVATLHGAFTHALHYCGQRVAFGKPVIEHQGLRWSLADVAMNMEAANALVFRAASAIQRDQEVTVLAAQAKTFAVATAIEGIQTCMQAMGAVGASAAHPLAMHAAEVRLGTYADGTSEMLRDRAGKSLLKSYPAQLPAIRTEETP
jgi:alkylation response protein AidB-like acyl-CoA dehydrogenase